MCGWSESAIVQGDNILGRVEQTKISKIIRFNYEWNWDSYFLNYVDILHLRCFGWYDSVQQVWNSKNNFHANTGLNEGKKNDLFLQMTLCRFWWII